MKLWQKIATIGALYGSILVGSKAIAETTYGDLFNEQGEIISRYGNEDEFLKQTFDYLFELDKNTNNPLSNKILLSNEKLCSPNMGKKKDGLVYLILESEPHERKSHEHFITHIETYDNTVNDNTHLYNTLQQALDSQEWKDAAKERGRTNVFAIEINLKRIDDNGLPMIDKNGKYIYDMQRIFDANGQEAVDIKGKDFRVNSKGIW